MAKASAAKYRRIGCVAWRKRQQPGRLAAKKSAMHPKSGSIVKWRISCSYQAHYLAENENTNQMARRGEGGGAAASQAAVWRSRIGCGVK